MNLSLVSSNTEESTETNVFRPGACFIADDVVTEGSAGTLSEEQFRGWLRDAFGLSATTDNNGRIIALEEEQQRAKQRALKLLRRFITPAQWEDYNSSGYFSQKDGKGRTWKFKKEHHYPIECDGQRICIDAERGAPDEDLLLQVWLEAIGGRGDFLLPESNIGWHYRCLIIDDMITERPQRHGVLCGISC